MQGIITDFIHQHHHKSVVGVVGRLWDWTYRCWPPTCQSFSLVCTQWSRLLSSAQQSGQPCNNKCWHFEFVNHILDVFFSMTLWLFMVPVSTTSVSCVYLLTDTSATINTHHPQSERFGELLALLGDLQSQLSGRSHDHGCNGRRKGSMWCVNKRHLWSAWGTVKVLKWRTSVSFPYRLAPLPPPGGAGPWCGGTLAAGRRWFFHCQSWRCQWGLCQTW